jgi:regulator of protease activity HflC (stomatin/prohibitin superfamily)
MRRAMAHQAEAERDRRARIISADGEYQASARLADAARVMADTPGAMQLRLLQTVSDVASDQNSTLVMPLPVELLRFFENATGGKGENTQATPFLSPTPAPDPVVPPPAVDGDGAGR